MAAGLLVSRRVSGSADFFVARRALPGWLVFATLLAANIGAGSTVGAAGLAYRHGLSAWWWSGSAALGCAVLGLWVAPRAHRLAAEHGFQTVGDILEWRYDRSVRALIAGALWLGTLTILGGQLIAMAWALDVIAGVPKAWGCALSGLVMVGYASRGGLLASAWVNLAELVVLLVGFLLAVPFALQAAGGWGAVAAAGAAAAGPGYASLTGMGAAGILGLAVVFVPSFIVSPGLVQKTFGAVTPRAAGRAALANAAALAAFAFVPAVLGMSARAVRPGLANPELALPTLLAEVLPAWLGALGLVALFAAEISTADAVLFMLSTSLAKDLYKTFLRPGADDAALLSVGRRASVIGGAAGVALAIALPSVLDALRAFYAVMTVTLFVPLLVALFARRPGAGWARASVVVSAATTLAAQLVTRGTPAGSWAPFALGIAAGAVVFAIGAAAERGRVSPA